MIKCPLNQIHKAVSRVSILAEEFREPKAVVKVRQRYKVLKAMQKVDAKITRLVLVRKYQE